MTDEPRGSGPGGADELVGPAVGVVMAARSADPTCGRPRCASRCGSRRPGGGAERPTCRCRPPDYLHFRMVTAYGGDGTGTARPARPGHVPGVVPGLAGGDPSVLSAGCGARRRCWLAEPPLRIRLVRVRVPLLRAHRSAHGEEQVRDVVLVEWTRPTARSAGASARR